MVGKSIGESSCGHMMTLRSRCLVIWTRCEPRSSGLAHSRLQQLDFNEFYTDLDIASERLWRLIKANDADWEGFRYTLEASCDELLCTFYRVRCAGSLIP